MLRLRLDDLPDALTVRQAADVLGISKNSTYEAIRRGEIPAVRIGRVIRVPALGLRKLLEGAAVPEEEAT